ncbi:C40 family peptidase [Krasilnikovia cinnamomea]|uniref:C40 family peptidase n=1 Tax=Krasilnikovia cinnamomea TaxID=349313 RepID=UPI0024151598|nr:NlpC/P60 family protein [Krasilnikovia cinnamomea]
MTAAAIAALFQPLPAFAAPGTPAPSVPAAPAFPGGPAAVPDAGSRPIPLGTLALPGQVTPTTAATTSPTPGVPVNPLLAKIEKRRADIATLGDQLIKLGEERDIARQQAAAADQKVTRTQATLVVAQQDAATAAENAIRDAAALPPGALGSGLQDLDSLAQIERGDSPGEQIAARQLVIAQEAQQIALDEQQVATTRATEVTGRYDRLNADIAKKQAALQKLEQQNADALNQAEALESAADARLGAGYLSGADSGRGADPRAVAAVRFALAQRGDPYVWSEEGPDEYDCSGLMYAAYRSSAAGQFPLARVSRDQYWQTRNKVVDRYSLLPGDLLFFSNTSSWTGIHHVAMYAGDGMMVEAPRTGLTVRLVPVRWTRLFQATRVYGSVDGPTEGPDLSSPAPKPKPAKTQPPRPTSKPTTTKPTTKPTTTKPSTPATPDPDPTSSTPSTEPSTPTDTPPSSSAAAEGAPPNGTSGSANSSGGTGSIGSSAENTSGSRSGAASSSASSDASDGE